MSYRVRVLGIILLVTLPLLVLAAGNLWRTVTDAESRVLDERMALARASSLTADAFVTGHFSTIRSLAFAPVLRDPAFHPELPTFLERVHRENPDWEGWGLSNAEGWNIATTNAEPFTLNIADRPYFQQVLATGRPTVSPAVINRRTGNPTIIVAAPVDFVDGSRGVVVASLSTMRLANELRSLHQDRSDIFTVVVDAQGQTFIHPDPAVTNNLTPVGGRVDVDAPLAGQSGWVQSTSLTGEDVLIAYAPVPSAGWAVRIVEPSTSALDQVRREFWTGLVLLLVTAIAALWLSWYLGGRLAGLYEHLVAARTDAERQRDRLQQVVDVLPEGILVADADGKLLIANVTALDLLGQPAANGIVFERPLFHVTHLDGSNYAPDALPLARAVRGEQVRGEQMLVTHTSGDTRPILVNAAPIRDASGQSIGAVVAFQDITAIKDLEEEKNAFLAAVSHDLQNPIGAIKGQAQLLLRRLARDQQLDRQRVVDGLTKIDETTNRTRGLIEQLLDLSRMQLGRPIELVLQPTDLVALTRRVVDEVAHTAERHQVRLDASEEHLVGSWDPGRIARVVENLVGNAIKYSPRGGQVTVRLTRELRADGTGHLAVLTVTDQGLGIPPTDLERVFQRFQRGSNVVGRIAGTGIGLAGARHIVEQHDGTIEVTSAEGAGSTFTVRLPLSTETPATPIRIGA